MKKAFATGAISLAIALQPAIAAAAPTEVPLEPAPAPTANTEITAPFDPICPLCFIREWIETIS